MPYISVTVATAPTAEVVTLGELKEAARITHGTHDLTLEAKIAAAVAAIEGYLRRKLATQSIDVVYREIDADGTVRVPYMPNSITSVKTTDNDSTVTTLSASDYVLLPGSDTLLFRSVPTIETEGWMTVRAAVGFSTIPTVIKEAVMKLATRYYLAEQGGAEVNFESQLTPQIPPDIATQLMPYRVVLL